LALVYYECTCFIRIANVLVLRGERRRTSIEKMEREDNGEEKERVEDGMYFIVARESTRARYAIKLTC